MRQQDLDTLAGIDARLEELDKIIKRKERVLAQGASIGVALPGTEDSLGRVEVEKSELIRRRAELLSNRQHSDPVVGSMAHLKMLYDAMMKNAPSSSDKKGTNMGTGKSIVMNGDYSDVSKAVSIVLKNDPLLDKFVEAAVKRLAPEIAKNVESGMSKTIEDTRKQLLSDVRNSFAEGMSQVADVFTELETDVGRQLEEAKAQMVQTVVIKQEPSGTAKDNEAKVKKMDGLFHELFPTLLTLLSTGNPVALTGPTQSAKSKHTELAAEALGLPYYYHAFGPTQTETALAGFVGANGEFNYRSLYLAARYGGIWVGDEADVVRDAGVLIWMNNLISNRTASFPMGKKSDALRAFEASINWIEADPLKQDMAGGSFKVHDNFKVILTMNTYGEGGSSTYRGRGFLDKSTLARFDFLYWGYDENLERAIVERAVPATTTSRWIYWSQAVRRAVAEEGVGEQIVVSPSNTIRGAKLLAAGLTWEQATEISLLPRKDDSNHLIDKVLAGARQFYQRSTGEQVKA